MDAVRGGTHWRPVARGIGWDLLEADGSSVDWNQHEAGPLLRENSWAGAEAWAKAEAWAWAESGTEAWAWAQAGAEAGGRGMG